MTSKQLMNAILSMDAYNRGYDEGIILTGDTTKIGNAIIGQDSFVLGTTEIDGEDIRNDSIIGFYALAYDLDGDEQADVISYRGTDYPENETNRDIVNGWGLGAGNVNSPQGIMALQFYNEVTGNLADPRTADIKLTGHSLGGGLAGHLAALHGKEADIFDSMTFVMASNNLHNFSMVDYALLPFENRPDESRYAYGQNLPWEPDYSKITGHYMEGEILGAMLTLRGGVAELNKYSIGPNVNLVSGWDGTALHDMAALVIRMFMDDNETITSPELALSSQYFWPVLYEDDFAAAIGMRDKSIDSNISGENQNQNEYSAILRKIIAYSALESGELPFGNTAIRALYSDANGLGRSLENAGSGSLIETLATDISKLYVHFAGQLALKDVEKSQSSAQNQGVVAYDAGILNLNTSDALWSDLIEDEDHGLTVTKVGLAESLLQELPQGDALGTIISQNWGQSFHMAFDHMAIKAVDSSVTSSLADLGTNAHQLYVGGKGVDTITGGNSHDFIMGANGKDILNGGLGNDILLGGAGDDRFVYSSGHDTIYGGAGNDALTGIPTDRGRILTDFRGVDENGNAALGLRVGFDGDDKNSIKTFGVEQGFEGTEHADTVNLTMNLKAPAGGVADYQTRLDLGGGDDVVLSSNYGMVITTGDGADKIQVSDNVFITDMSFEDRIYANNTRITGGGRKSHSESPWVITQAGHASVNNEGDLVVRDLTKKTAYFANYKNTLEGHESNTGGVYLFETEWSTKERPNIAFLSLVESAAAIVKVMGHYMKAMTGTNPLTGMDPLVLDLDNDGLELTTNNYVTGQYFDIQDSGFAMQMGWVDADDGFLVWDKNDNGLIDSVDEMFGNVGVTGLSELSDLDENADGLINITDSYFTDLKIWRDLNQDAVTDPGELFTLNDFNIQSLSVNPSTTKNTNNNGHIIDSTAQFTFSDGSTGIMGDVLFDTTPYSSKFLGDTSVSGSALLLPNVKGHGTLPDLHVAMTLNPQLEVIVANALTQFNTPNLESLRNAIRPVLDGWVASYDVRPELAGTDQRVDVPIFVTTKVSGGVEVYDFGIERKDENGNYWELASKNDVLDDDGNAIERPLLSEIKSYKPSDVSDGYWTEMTAGEVIFLERYFGMEMPLGVDNIASPESISAMGNSLNTLWAELNKIVASLATQGGELEVYFHGVQYNVEKDKFHAPEGRDLAPMLETIFASAPGNKSGDMDHLEEWKPLVHTVINNYYREHGSIVSYAYLFKNIVTAYENTGLSLSVEETASLFDLTGDDILNSHGDVNGSDGDDMFYMNNDNEVAIGGDGSDNYIIGKNFGQDIIRDIETSPIGSDHLDIVRFAHYNSDDLTFSREKTDLIIATQSGDALRIEEQFAGRRPGGGFFGATSVAKGVSEIVFADGEVWDRIDITNNAPLTGTLGDDILVGSYGMDYLDGKGGNDVLSGKEGTDFYYYNAGYGHTTIDDDIDIQENSTDFVMFGEGISFGDLIFIRDSYSSDLNIKFSNSPDDLLTIKNQFRGLWSPFGGVTWLNPIENFEFHDGSRYSLSSMLGDIITSQSSEDDDDIYGFFVDDTLDGGKGNDNLYGGEGNDTYIYGRGYGFDTIEDFTKDLRLEIGLDNKNVIQFLPDILPQDIRVHKFLNDTSEDRSHIYLTIKDTGDTLKIQNSERQVTGRYYTIDEVHFDDGTVWLHQDLRDMAIAEAATESDDVIIGFNSDDIINGGLGNDRLEGDAGSDTYIWSDQEGNDIIYDEQRYISDDSQDKVKFSNLNIDDVQIDYSGPGRGLVFTSLNNGATLTIENQERSSLPYEKVEEFHFQNGDVYTHQEIRQIYLDNIPVTGGTITGFHSSNDILEGGIGDDKLIGLDGDDTYIYGLNSGNDVIHESDNNTYKDNDTVIFEGISYSDVSWHYDFSSKSHPDLVFTLNSTGNTLTINAQEGNKHALDRVENFVFEDITKTNFDFLNDHFIQEKTNGNDIIIGFRQYDDVLDGGLGDDYLSGLGGNDTYIYGRNYGHDTIYDDSYYSSAWANTKQDKIKFIDGLNIDDFDIRFEKNDLILNAKFFDGSVTIENYSGSRDRGVELYDFNSVIWTISDIYDYLRNEEGYIPQVIIESGELHGIYDQNNMLTGSVGNDELFGENKDDVLIGNLGDDYLRGNNGDDTYIYKLGDGNDVILDSGGYDVIKFGQNILPGDVSVLVEDYWRDNITLRFDNNDEKIILDNQERYGDNRNSIEGIEFADGTIWTNADLRRFIIEQSITEGNDNSIGFDSSDDIFYSSDGNDKINGNNGFDIVIYDKDFDNYTIENTSRSHRKIITDIIGDDGIDTIEEMEELHFSDGIYNITTEIFTPQITNSNPIARNDSFVTDEDVALNGNVLADNGNGMDSDADGDSLSVISGTYVTVQGGSVVVSSNGNFTYTPTAGYFGADSFSYTVQDGRGGSDTAIVSLTVNEVIEVPSNPQAPTGNVYLLEGGVTEAGLGSSSAINTGNYLAKTQGVAFETGSDVTSLQVLYEQGGGSRGLNIFVKDGKLYAAVWNNKEENWGYKEVSSDIDANTKYTATFVMDGVQPSNGSATLYLNGEVADTVNGVGQLYAHGGDISIASIGDSTRINGSKVSTDANFSGNIEKLVQYNTALSGSEIDDLNMYLAHNWIETMPQVIERPDLPKDAVLELENLEGITGVPDSSAINKGKYLEKTHAMSFETGSDVNTLQVIYEQGGSTRGLNIYLLNGKLYASVWNNSQENWGTKLLDVNIEANTQYITTLVMDGVLPKNGDLSLYLNGELINTLGGVGKLYNHKDNIGIGSINGGTQITNASYGSAIAFTGTIEKIVQYNKALERAELDQLHMHLSHDNSTITPNPVKETTIMEFGSVDADHNIVTVDLNNSFTNPVVFLTKTTMNDGDLAVARITDIRSNQFSFYTQEADYLDGTRRTETFSYIVMEEGQWTLDDGTKIEIGTLDTSAMRSDRFETVDFERSFSDTPVVISQIQTNNDTVFVDTRQNNTTTEGFQLMLQEEELSNNGIHGVETVGWFAIKQGAGTSNGHDFFADVTDDNIDHKWSDILFDNHLEELPQLLAQISTYDGADPSFVSVDNLNVNSVQVSIQEDQSKNSETTHTTERYDIFAIEGNGYLTAAQIDEFA